MEEPKQFGLPSLLVSTESRDANSTEDNTITGPQMEESLSTEWTDEKHSLYISSIEASFVKQLHNHNYRSMDLHGWLSRRQKVLDQNSSQSNGKGSFSSDQFKVLRSGCWEKLNFERTRPRMKKANESCLLLENQFIQHFSPASMAKELEVTPKDIQQHGKLISEVVHLGGQKHRRAACELGTSSKQLSPCYPAICHRDSVGRNTGRNTQTCPLANGETIKEEFEENESFKEMSDQNFVEDCVRDQLISSCKKRRTVDADVSSKDQVVPLCKSPVTENANENYSEKKEDEHCSGQKPESMTKSALPKYGPSGGF